MVILIYYHTEVCRGVCLWFCCVHLLYHVVQVRALLTIFQLSKSKELSLKLVDDFEEKCRKETNTSSLEFGPREFDKGRIRLCYSCALMMSCGVSLACTAIKTCLKHVQQRVFNTGFSTIPCSHMCILNITNFRLIANLASLKQV